MIGEESTGWDASSREAGARCGNGGTPGSSGSRRPRGRRTPSPISPNWPAWNWPAWRPRRRRRKRKPRERAAARAAVAEPAPPPAAATVVDTPVPEPAGLTGRSLADVATSLWRLRARIERMDDPPRALVRHLESAWDAFADAGVEIKDHAGEPFDHGLAMSVAAYQPTPGLHRELIIETVRPGVYLGDRSVQMAEVIVGTPERAPEPAAERAEEPTGAMEETRGR
ncbi:hypothetical protein BJF79_09260 [Actinomadura sp. CNU-125]|uniref:hypothetical protein n=1 Tax=Actinomadura sp. CNU-125 TaxID=1904961 RepID=UPI00095F0630|nr:hypothetical protein [Actinomadura sp. CNU-125]OLT30782.1 hypothetical protein BJF79_09260 [Actinomadura sp. CNU-125]